MTALQSALRKMELLAERGWADAEGAHMEADRLLMNVIRGLGGGHPEAGTINAILEAYDDVDKWFA